MMLTGVQIRMARACLRWTAKELSEQSGVAYSTIKRMEDEDGVPSARGPNIAAIYQTLVKAGLEFIPENGGGPGVRVKKQD